MNRQPSELRDRAEYEQEPPSEGSPRKKQKLEPELELEPETKTKVNDVDIVYVPDNHLNVVKIQVPNGCHGNPEQTTHNGAPFTHTSSGTEVDVMIGRKSNKIDVNEHLEKYCLKVEIDGDTFFVCGLGRLIDAYEDVFDKPTEHKLEFLQSLIGEEPPIHSKPVPPYIKEKLEVASDVMKTPPYAECSFITGSLAIAIYAYLFDVPFPVATN